MIRLLPHEHHVARHLRAGQVDDGVIGAAAFHARPNEDSVSVYHLEYFATCDQAKQQKCAQRELNAAKAAGFKDGRDVKGSHRFAVVNVGRGTSVAQRISPSVLFKAAPVPGVEFHAGIFGYDNDQLGALVAAALRDEAVLSASMKDLPGPGTSDCARR